MKTLERVVGCWTWTLSIARAGYAVPDEVFQWIAHLRSSEVSVTRWLEAARGELKALAFLAPILKTTVEKA